MQRESYVRRVWPLCLRERNMEESLLSMEYGQFLSTGNLYG